MPMDSFLLGPRGPVSPVRPEHHGRLQVHMQLLALEVAVAVIIISGSSLFFPANMLASLAIHLRPV